MDVQILSSFDGRVMDMINAVGIVVMIDCDPLSAGIRLAMQQGARWNEKMEDIEGAGVVTEAGDRWSFIDVYKPRERFVRLVADGDTPPGGVRVNYVFYREKRGFRCLEAIGARMRIQLAVDAYWNARRAARRAK